MVVKLRDEEFKVGAYPTGWRLDYLENLCTTSSGTTPLRSMLERYYRNGTIYWVKTTDLTNSDIYTTEEMVTKAALDETSLRVYPVGTVLVAMYGGFNQIGRTGLLRIPATVNQSITAIQVNPKLLFSEYLINVLNYGISYWRTVASSSRKDPNITSYDIKKVPIFFPDVKEQRAIATAFSDVDALIASLDKLIAKKLNIKQATMQQLLTGKTRLLRFNEEWEIKKLGEVVEIKKGQLLTKAKCISGNIPVIAGGKQSAYFHNKPNRFKTTITISASGANAGYVSLHETPIFASDCSTIEEGNGYFLRYIYYHLELIQETIYKMQSGGAQPHINPKDLFPIEIQLPHLEEQQAIANVLSDMDAEITALEQKRDKIRALKQGMMQELLTGKTRLV